MLPLIKKILLILICNAFISCNHTEDNSSKVTWIGGEIVNPKLDYVIFSKDHKILDTVSLNENNFFLYKSDCLTEGVYSFNHYEYQMFYLEPNDSLMLRVNTVDFDESLAFSGKGAERNNLLMDFFLQNEQETKLMPVLYQLPPKEFQKTLDSLTKSRLELYNEFIVKNPSERGFKEIAKANINYDSYIKKEMYTSAKYAKKAVEISNDFPKDFYDYRKKVDLGSDKLQSYYPYYRFLNRYFDNLAYEKYNDEAKFDRYSHIHTYNKIKILDDKIAHDSLKNRLMRANVINYLLGGKDAEKGEAIVNLYSKINTNQEFNREIKKLCQSTMKLIRGKKIPDLLLLNTENTIKDLHSIVNKPTVLFFWSAQSVKHFQSIHDQAAELNSKYPEYDFIGINTDTHFKRWRNTVIKYRFDRANEFQFDNIDDAESKLVISSTNKAIIIDKDGIILEGNTSLFNQKIETILRGLLNQLTSR